MAQPTKRKRKTKHRGNAAGMIETRGRTGKPPEAERKRGAKASAGSRRMERVNRPPSWRSAVTKAAIAAVFFAVAVTVAFKRPIGAAIALAVFTFLIYVPLSYYTDAFLFKRHRARAKS